MKTPDEIKKWLKCWAITYTDECTGDCENCEYNATMDSSVMMGAVALEYINQLEQRLAQAERERDAAVEDMEDVADGMCHCCKNQNLAARCDLTGECYCCENSNCPCHRDNCKWVWRGVCAENSKEDSK